jgi:pimeloyl-ACP methyl ester carboxylesterase
MTEGTTTVRTDANGERRLGRRAMLAGTTGLAVTGLVARLGTSRPVVAQEDPSTFVLVPGQWTGAFVWHTVAPLLREAGHDVYAITCTGLGDRVHLASPTIDLDTHITDVVNTIEFEDLHDIILVGHSYAGMIITGVAERVPERLRLVVYLDADVPTDGQNNYDVLVPEVRDREILADITGGVDAGMPGFRPVFPGVEEWLRGAITDPAEADWFIAKLVPHPELSNLQPVKLGNPAAAALPRAFILCTADKDLEADPQTDSLVLAAERARSDPNWTVIEMNDTHMVNLNNPAGTVEALVSLI